MWKTAFIICLFVFSVQGQINRSHFGRFNEQKVRSFTRLIHSAQMTYQSSYGQGNYATNLNQLINSFQIDQNWSIGERFGYRLNLIANNGNQTSPPTFYLQATPISYGKNNRISFFIDQTGIIRGADKQGLPADENDLPIGEN